MTTQAENRLSLAIGIAVAIGFLIFALRDTELAAVAERLSTAQLRFIPAIAGALLLQFWFKAQRWSILLRPFANTTSRQVFPATVVGYLANLVFPLYLGEVARVYVLGRHLNLNYSSVLATVMLERLFDFLSVLFFVGLVLVLDPQSPPALKTAGIVSGSISAILLAGFLAYLNWTQSLTKFVLRLASFLPATVQAGIAEQMGLLADGMSSIRDIRLLPAIAMTSILQWGAMGLCIYLGLIATNLETPVSAGFVILALIVMGVTLPSSPGFFGTIQLCFTLGLAPYGIDASEAFAASLVFHLTIYCTGWVAGFMFMKRAGLDFAALRRSNRRA